MAAQQQVVYVQGPLPPMQQYAQSGTRVQIVPQPQAVPTNQNTGGDRRNFAKDSQKRCGICQILLGILAMIIASVMIPLGVGMGIGYVGTGLWCGPFMIIAGSFGVWSYSKQTSGPIVSCMVMSILASCFGFVFFCMSVTSCAIDNDPYNRRWGFYGDNSGRIAVSVLGILVGLAEVVVSIIQSAICCRTTCCGGPQQSGSTIVYIPQPFPAQYALQTQGVVQGTPIPAGSGMPGQVTVVTPGATVYPAVGYAQGGGYGAPHAGTPYAGAPYAGPAQQGPAPGPVAPPQYSAQVPAPPAYAEKPQPNYPEL